jgi:hypothetical protein
MTTMASGKLLLDEPADGVGVRAFGEKRKPVWRGR